MPDARKKFENLLFQHGTTYLTDYRRPELAPSTITKFIEKPRHVASSTKRLKDVHTMSEWKTHVPFDLLLKPRPIVATDPRNVQEKYSAAIDNERDVVMRTRPRVVLTPAVSMDDIEDPQARKLLCEDIYRSVALRSQQEAVTACVNVNAPMTRHPAPAKPISLRKLQPPFVSPEWRKETVTWDSQQLRSYCDPTREFWLASKPS